MSRGLRIETRDSGASPYVQSKALVIGVSHYAGPWPQLANSVADAYLVSAALEREHGFRITLLVDDAPRFPVTVDTSTWVIRRVDSITAPLLASEIRSFLVNEGQDPSTRLLAWYAGHGATIDAEGFLVGGSAPHPSDPSFALHAVQMRDIGNWVRLARSRHVLFVFDSCFGATIFEPRYQVRPAMSPGEMQLPVRQFITSGGPDEEVADESAFRVAFIEALQGRDAHANPNGDAFLTGSELGLYLAQRIQHDTSWNQTPQYGELLDPRFDRGNFLFVWRGGNDRPGPTSPPGEETLPLPFRDCEGCPELVAVQPGTGTGAALPHAPVAAAFAIGVYEVTFAEWDLCVDEGACSHLPDDAGWGRGRRPVIRVNLSDVLSYLDWLSRKTGHLYRLPTSEEWEYAARGGLDPSTEYWFGDEMQAGRAHCRGCGGPSRLGTLPVGTFGGRSGAGNSPILQGGRNGFGTYDMHGNVWEWVCTRRELAGGCEDALVRGGSWANSASFSRSASWVRIPAQSRSTGVGFRVVRELETVHAAD